MNLLNATLEGGILELLEVKTGAMTARELAGLIYCKGPDEDGRWQITAAQLAKVRRELRALRDRGLVFPIYRTRGGHRWANREAAQQYVANVLQAYGKVGVSSDPAIRQLLSAQKFAA